jgi:hypothetical protein
MQLLPTSINSVASNNRIEVFAILFFEVFAKLAEVLVGNAYVLEFAHDKLNDNDIVKIANDQDVVEPNIFGIGGRKLPFIVGQHADQGFELWNSLADEVRQRLIFANFVEHIGDCFNESPILPRHVPLHEIISVHSGKHSGRVHLARMQSSYSFSQATGKSLYRSMYDDLP